MNSLKDTQRSAADVDELGRGSGKVLYQPWSVAYERAETKPTPS